MCSVLCTVARYKTKITSIYQTSSTLRTALTSRNMTQCTYNYLGSSGLKVSNICLGTMVFGEHPVCIKLRDHSENITEGVCYFMFGWQNMVANPSED